MTAVNEAEHEEMEALFARLDGQTTDGGVSEAMKLHVVRLVTGKPAAAYALAKVFLDQERALAAARDHIDRLERGTLIPAVGGAGDTAGVSAACGFARPLRNGGFTTAVRSAAVGVVGSLALGSTVMEMLRVDPAAAAGSSHYDPDDVDALGFDDDPESTWAWRAKNDGYEHRMGRPNLRPARAHQDDPDDVDALGFDDDPELT